jgi:hypothetical protein
MKKRLIFGLLLCILLPILRESAARAGSENLGFYYGGGTNFENSLNLNLGVKLRALKYCPFELELMAIIPYGFSIAAPVYIFKSERLKFYFILPFMGVYFPISQRLSIGWMKKNAADLMSGGGIETRFNAKNQVNKKLFNHFTINVDWRAFIPNPFYLKDNFGDYGNKIFWQSLKEGEIWVGIIFWR